MQRIIPILFSLLCVSAMDAAVEPKRLISSILQADVQCRVKTTLLSVLMVVIGMFHPIASAMAQAGSNLPPSIVLTNPPSGIMFEFPATIRLKASASDPDGSIVEVRFYETYEGMTKYLGMVTELPYNLVTINSPSFIDLGDYYYFAVAIDNDGARGTSAPVKIVLVQDVRAPEVAISQPSDGQMILTPGSFPIVAIVNSLEGSEEPVFFYSETNLIGSVDAPPYVLTISNLPPGQHVLTARYVNGIGNLGVSQPVRITITSVFLTGASLGNDGQFRFTIGGLVTGKVFEVQVSSNLLAWSPVSTNTASSNLFHFASTGATNCGHRFYRAWQSP